MAATLRSVKLKEVCDRITVGHVGPMADKYTVEGIPFLRSQNITPFRLDLEDIKYIPREFHEKLRKSALRPGDVAVVRTGYPGTACVIPEKFAELNCADLVVITPSVKLNPHYLAAIFNSAWGIASVAGNLVGVAQQHFNIGAAKELEVGLPSRPVQDRIAGILSAYDELIENSQRRIKILESMARALYREWFVHFRFPGHESVPRVPSLLGEIPKGWEVTTLGRLVEIKKGKSITKGTIRDGNVPVVAGGIAPAYFHDAPNTRRPVITISASGANAGFVNLYHVDVWASDCSYIDSSATPHVLYYYLWLDHRRAAITHLQRGSAQPHVYPKDLAQLEALGAPEDVLNAFASQVAPTFGLAMHLAAKIENLRRTRDLLLPRLLSGQIDVEAIP